MFTVYILLLAIVYQLLYKDVFGMQNEVDTAIDMLRVKGYSKSGRSVSLSESSPVHYALTASDGDVIGPVENVADVRSRC